MSPEENVKSWSELLRDVYQRQFVAAPSIDPERLRFNPSDDWLVRDIWEQLLGLRPVNGGPRIR